MRAMCWPVSSNDFFHAIYPAATAEPDTDDIVRFGEAGWKERYYFAKFQKELKDQAFLRSMTYVRPLSPLLMRGRSMCAGCAGCCSTTSAGAPTGPTTIPSTMRPLLRTSIKSVRLPCVALTAGRITPVFDHASRPITPYEQLMSVLPPASAEYLPPPLRDVMCDPESELAQYYPLTFGTDLNGKRHSWQGGLRLCLQRCCCFRS